MDDNPVKIKGKIYLHQSYHKEFIREKVFSFISFKRLVNVYNK